MRAIKRQISRWAAKRECARLGHNIEILTRADAALADLLTHCPTNELLAEMQMAFAVVDGFRFNRVRRWEDDAVKDAAYHIGQIEHWHVDFQPFGFVRAMRLEIYEALEMSKTRLDHFSRPDFDHFGETGKRANKYNIWRKGEGLNTPPDNRHKPRKEPTQIRGQT